MISMNEFNKLNHRKWSASQSSLFENHHIGPYSSLLNFDRTRAQSVFKVLIVSTSSRIFVSKIAKLPGRLSLLVISSYFKQIMRFVFKDSNITKGKCMHATATFNRANDAIGKY